MLNAEETSHQMITNLIHRTCKMYPLYLVKSRQLLSDRSQYQIKRVNNTTILRQSENFWKSQFMKLVI